MVIIGDIGGKVGWLGRGKDQLHAVKDLELVGEGEEEGGGEGGAVLASKILLSAVSPLIHLLSRGQEFCGGCTQRTTVILPWASHNTIRSFVGVLEDLKDDGILSNQVGNGAELDSIGQKELKELMNELMINPTLQDAILVRLSQKTRRIPVLIVIDHLSSEPNTMRSQQSDDAVNLTKQQKSKGTKRKLDDFEELETDREFRRNRINPAVRIERLDLTRLKSKSDENQTIMPQPGPSLMLSFSPRSHQVVHNVSPPSSPTPEHNLTFECSPPAKPKDTINYTPTPECRDLLKCPTQAEHKDTLHHSSTPELNDTLNYSSETGNKGDSPPTNKGISTGSSQSEPKSILQCSLCILSVPHRSVLYHHYALKHFKDKMAKFSDCEICPICQTPLKSSNAIFHLAATHSYVERFLPLEHHVKKLKKGRKKANRIMKPGKIHSCFKCDFTAASRRCMYAHYAGKHFKAEILALIAGRKVCMFCKKKFHEGMTVSDIVRHIGVAHSVVEDFISSEMHILKKPSSRLDISCKKKQGDHDCFKCKYSTSVRKDMYGHLATVHFKNEILAQLDGSKSCLYCDKQFHEDMRVDSIVRHLGVSHSMVEQFISPEFHIKKAKAKMLPEKILACCLCDFKTITRQSLYCHYACGHFQKQIEENYGKETTCSICGEHLSGDTWEKLRHIGVTHNVVEEFLDSKYHLKKRDVVVKEKETISETSNDEVEYLGEQSFADFSSGEIYVEDQLEDEDNHESTSETSDLLNEPFNNLKNIKTEDTSIDENIEIVDHLSFVVNIKQETQTGH